MDAVGRYNVLWEIGRGGMATVYVARDPLMKRKVAVKVMSSKLAADPDFRTRFHREAEVIAALEHPYIVPVYDFGEQDEQPFIIMRYMPGGSLGKRIKKAPLSVAEAAHILERMAAALTEAHRRGIVHRDFKPDNILFDDQEEAFLGDFGIVHLLSSSQTLTSAGAIAGTPAYMAPEQVHGDDEIDGRADVYAMGATLFELLTGQTPFQAKDATRVMMKQVLDPVPDIRSIRPDLPEALEIVIKKAMAKQADQRYQTPLELADAVAGVGRQVLSRRARRRLTSDDLDAMYDALSDEEE